jgi:drug/metabolite transporter (DMT)-like permease
VSSERTGALLATSALTLVGTSFVAADALERFPVLGGQGVRYALGALALLAVARGRVPRVDAGQLARLALLAATGLAAFNVLVLLAVRETDPGSVGVVVGCVPIVLALAGPLAEGRAPDPRVVLAAATVALGAAVVQGAGGGMGLGALLLCLGALACEAAFSLLAAPLLPALGPLGVSLWAALQVLVLGVVFLVVAVACDGVWALAAGTAARRLRARGDTRRWLDRVSGIVYLGLGAAAALAGEPARRR